MAALLSLLMILINEFSTLLSLGSLVEAVLLRHHFFWVAFRVCLSSNGVIAQYRFNAFAKIDVESFQLSLRIASFFIR